MRVFQRLALVLAALLGSVAASAHPGHGVGDGTSLLHYLTSPLHVGRAMLVLTALAGLSMLQRRKATARLRRPRV